MKTEFLKYTGLTIVILLMVVDSGAEARPPLQTVLEEAAGKSHTLNIGRAELDKAQFKRHMVYQTYLPNVEFNTSFRSLDERIQFQVDPVSFPLPGGNDLQVQVPPVTLQDRNTFRANVEVTQVLFTGFKVPRLGRAARHGEQAAEWSMEADKQELLKEVTEAYDKLALLDQSLKVIDRADERLEEEQRVADQAYEEGLIPAFDLTRLRIAQRDLEKQRIGIEGKRELAARNLEHLSGIGWEQFLEDTSELSLIAIDPANLKPDNRPEIKALEEAGRAADQKYRAARSDYLPEVYAFFRQELYEDDLSVLEPTRAMGVGLRWNVFDGFNRSRKVQKAERDRIIARERLEEVTSLSSLDQKQAEVKFSVADQQLRVSEETLKDARTSLRLSRERYRLGLGPVSEQLEAETDYQKAELDWLEAVYDQRRAAIDLLRASGTMSVDRIVMLEQN